MASGNVTVSASGVVTTTTATNARVEIYAGNSKLRMVYTVKVN
ncbi:hypothetical protein [Paenibacillus polymyxa]|nr:hypothetical protein [Paenibacillus polymyxa]MDN4082850.1 hypothetical protein [Paenibacillus polymyxa]MDN4088279.1 hypothetical protein [Paenibacillus polymyxa]MDN4107728.1 hypothetical protein [Paenibacillus polymyxa]